MSREQSSALSLGLFDTDYTDGFAIQIPGETYPRIHITANGKVKTGDGTVPPTEISGGGTFGTTAGTYAEGNDSRITGSAQKAQNLADLASAATARTNLGLGTAATTAASAYATAAQGATADAAAQKAQNLADLASAATARTNLGLGTAAVAASTDFLASSATLPWRRRVDIPAYSKPSTVSGTYTLVYAAEFSASRGASANTNDQSWTWADLPLSAGTWVADVYFRGLTSGGIATLTVTGSSGVTADTYTASTTTNSLVTTSSFTIGTSGYKDLVVTNATKNAASSNYALNINAIILRRTGA